MVTGRDSWKLIGLLWICYLSAQTVLVSALRSFQGKLSIEHLALLNSAVLVLVLLLPTLLFVLRKGQSWREAFRWRRVPLRVIVATVLGTLALGLAVSQVTLWLIRSLENSVFLEHSKFTNLLVATSRTNSPVLLLLAVMFPALPEELTFRGVIQQGFERRYSPAIAIALTSFIFALFHLDLIQALSVMAIAAFWGWVAWRVSKRPAIFDRPRSSKWLDSRFYHRGEHERRRFARAIGGARSLAQLACCYFRANILVWHGANLNAVLAKTR
jgi:membrane protease YdiL (CAAX protease family)